MTESAAIRCRALELLISFPLQLPAVVEHIIQLLRPLRQGRHPSSFATAGAAKPKHGKAKSKATGGPGHKRSRPVISDDDDDGASSVLSESSGLSDSDASDAAAPGLTATDNAAGGSELESDADADAEGGGFLVDDADAAAGPLVGAGVSRSNSAGWASDLSGSAGVGAALDHRCMPFAWKQARAAAVDHTAAARAKRRDNAAATAAAVSTAASAAASPARSCNALAAASVPVASTSAASCTDDTSALVTAVATTAAAPALAIVGDASVGSSAAAGASAAGSSTVAPQAGQVSGGGAIVDGLSAAELLAMMDDEGEPFDAGGVVAEVKASAAVGPSTVPITSAASAVGTTTAVPVVADGLSAEDLLAMMDEEGEPVEIDSGPASTGNLSSSSSAAAPAAAVSSVGPQAVSVTASAAPAPLPASAPAVASSVQRNPSMQPQQQREPERVSKLLVFAHHKNVLSYIERALLDRSPPVNLVR